MRLLSGFLFTIITVHVVVCRTYIRPVNKKKSVPFQWQFQSSDGDSESTMVMLPTNHGPSASASASASSGSGSIKIIHFNDDDDISQTQSQSLSNNNGVIKMTSSSNKKGLPNSNSGVIKIKISNPYMPLNDVQDSQVSSNNKKKPIILHPPLVYPLIHYVYALPNIKVTPNKNIKKGVIKFFPVVSASASSSSSGQQQSQSVTIDADVLPEESETDVEDDDDSQTQILTPVYDTYKPHSVQKPKGKMNVDDNDKLCGEENQEQRVFCKNQEAQIACENNKTLQIIQADFGRMSNSFCLDKDIYSKDLSQNCSKSVLDVVRNSCENKETCNIKTDTFWEENQCAGRTQYLQIIYRCEC